MKNLQELSRDLEKVSPLYDYWKSDQDVNDELLRLSKAAKSSPGLELFKEEPYKWENLFQSILREFLVEKYDSIRGLSLLLNMLNEETKNQTIDLLIINKIVDDHIKEKIIDWKPNGNTTGKNRYRYIKILFAIFTNPYSIQIKGRRQHLYEHTGFWAAKIREII